MHKEVKRRFAFRGKKQPDIRSGCFVLIIIYYLVMMKSKDLW